MACVLSDFISKGVSNAPRWIKDSVMFESKAGSFAYGVHTKDSDVDYVGYCIPPKNMVFRLDEIPGFGTQLKRFEEYRQEIVFQGQDYDFTCYSIVKYFDLCMDANPNMVETLFYPVDCISFSSPLHEIVKGERRIFLHKGAYHRFKGFAYSQISACLKVPNEPLIIAIRKFEDDNIIPHWVSYNDLLEELRVRESHSNPEHWSLVFAHLDNNDLNIYKNHFENGLNKTKRFVNQKIHNQDNKFLYHVARLANYARQILQDYDLDVRQDKEYWKAIRRGEVSMLEIKAKFEEEERQLQKLYETSKIPHSPNEPRIKQLLIDCLESHYGNLAHLEKPDKYKIIVEKMEELLRNSL